MVLMFSSVGFENPVERLHRMSLFSLLLESTYHYVLACKLELWTKSLDGLVCMQTYSQACRNCARVQDSNLMLSAAFLGGSISECWQTLCECACKHVLPDFGKYSPNKNYYGT
eukprot:5258249-Amphidinium_carterae.2